MLESPRFTIQQGTEYAEMLQIVVLTRSGLISRELQIAVNPHVSQSGLP